MPVSHAPGKKQGAFIPVYDQLILVLFLKNTDKI